MAKLVPVKLDLGQGHYALVDAEDANYLSRFKWHKSALGYAVRKTPKLDMEALGLPAITRMHCVIAGTLKDMTTDHINGDKLDNRRVNLRLCSIGQNKNNRPGWSKSGYKGVSKRRYGWETRIADHHLGSFKTKEEAAHVYNQVAEQLYGEFAWLNKLEVHNG